MDMYVYVLTSIIHRFFVAKKKNQERIILNKFWRPLFIVLINKKWRMC